MDELFIRGFYISWDEIDKDNYLNDIEAISNINEYHFNKPVTFFVGENGSGKSTLLEAIALAYGFNGEGGTKNYRFSTYDSHSDLYKHMTLIKSGLRPKHNYFLRAESFYNVATKENEYQNAAGGKPLFLHEKSHGESFLEVFRENFVGNGLYLLDEPEAALSPSRLMTLLIEIDRCAKDGAQFIIATHSPILLSYPDSDIITFDDGLIHKINYEDTSSYKIIKMFINDKERIIKNLLEK